MDFGQIGTASRILKLALLIEINDYSSVRDHGYRDLPSQYDQMKLLELNLRQYDFKTYLCIQSSTVGGDDSNKQQTLLKQIDLILKKINSRAESAEDYDQRLFILIYYRGQGLITSDHQQTCGVADSGFVLQLFKYAQFFAQFKNVVTFLHMDCPRVRTKKL